MFKTLLLCALLIGCNAQATSATATDEQPLANPAMVTDYRNGDCVRVYRSDPRLAFTLSGVEQPNVGCLAFIASGDDAIDTRGATVLVEHDPVVCTCSAR